MEENSEVSPNTEISDLAADLTHNTEMFAVVSAHIRIESILIKIVETRFPCPEHIKKFDLDYAGYVTAALCLGMNKNLEKPLRTLGSIRNKFAHKLKTKMDKNITNNFYESLEEKEKVLLNNVTKDVSGSGKKIVFKNLDEMSKFRVIMSVLYSIIQHELEKSEQIKKKVATSIQKTSSM